MPKRARYYWSYLALSFHIKQRPGKELQFQKVRHLRELDFLDAFYFNV